MSRMEELVILDRIERDLEKLLKITDRENMVKSLQNQVRFFADSFFVPKFKDMKPDTDEGRMIASRIVFELEGGRKISTHEIGQEIYPYIRHLIANGMKGIMSEKKYVSKAKKTYTYYFLKR
jgi:hypothetical protein